MIHKSVSHRLMPANQPRHFLLWLPRTSAMTHGGIACGMAPPSGVIGVIAHDVAVDCTASKSTHHLSTGARTSARMKTTKNGGKKERENRGETQREDRKQNIMFRQMVKNDVFCFFSFDFISEIDLRIFGLVFVAIGFLTFMSMSRCVDVRFEDFFERNKMFQ